MIQEEPLLRSEGSWRAAREEYAKRIFWLSILNIKRSIALMIKQDPDIFIGVLGCRRGTCPSGGLRATKGDSSSIGNDAAQEIVEFFITDGSYRNAAHKTDQAAFM